MPDVASPAAPPPLTAPPPAPRPERRDRRCANCGERLHGPYCASCGQHDDPIQQPVSHFAREAFSEYFGFDGRLSRSMGGLLFRPGFLTLEYVAGRRVRYLRPFRLYLTATVLFFFALALVDPASELDAGDTEPALARTDTLLRAADRIEDIEAALGGLEASRAALDQAGPLALEGDGLVRHLDSVRRALILEMEVLDELPRDSLVRPGQAHASDSLAAALNSPAALEEEADGNDFYTFLPDWLKGPAIERLEQARTREEKREAVRGLVRGVIGRVPTVMFLLLPVFAACLKVLYASGGGLRRPARRSPWRARRMRRRLQRPWRRAARAVWVRLPLALRARRRTALRHVLTAKRRRYLSEHLVFALHVHAFAFLVFLVILLVGQLGEGLWVQRAVVALAWVIPLYFLLAMKRVYAQGWAKTIVKTLFLSWVYGTALFFGAILALALAATLG